MKMQKFEYFQPKFLNLISFCLILVSSLFLSGCASMQQKRLKKVEQTYDMLQSMKANTLLIRLQRSQKKIDGLRKIGQDKQADKEEKDVAITNTSIIESFKEDFDFCDVVYFYSEDGKSVREGKFDQVTFYNLEDEIINDVKIDKTAYYITEYSRTYSDMLIHDFEDGSKRAVAGSNGMPSMILMDSNYIIVSFSKTSIGVYNPLSNLRKFNIRESIKAMNRALHSELIEQERIKMNLEMKLKVRKMKSDIE